MRDVNDEDNDDDVNYDDNAKTIPHTSYPNSKSMPTSAPAVAQAYAATDYADISPDEKTKLMHSLIQWGHLRGTALREIVKLHDGVSRTSDGKKPKSAKEMVAHFIEHRRYSAG
ncbi:hypothetical protein GGX14DRAFT_398262 [Mycena pura]|uniref:Uncharacterized protein n=1 Tax=Mycena pura TaxID=153505 RepID=A0AAD6V6R9_9AGAR|nr:hypothetical protein GGX14DRAFT_398262 [Mycena pura]